MIGAAQQVSDRPRSTAHDRLLDVRNLSVSFDTVAGIQPAISAVSFEIGAGEAVAVVGESGAGEAVAVVGESGSGKTVTALSTIGLLPDNARVAGGTVSFEGRPLDPERNASYAGVRGARMAMIFQEPMTSLNPVLTSASKSRRRWSGTGVSTGARRTRTRSCCSIGSASPMRRDEPGSTCISFRAECASG